MQQLSNLLWAVILAVGLSLALDAVGVDLSTDFDGKQLPFETECRERGGELKLAPNGVLWQKALICQE